MVPSRAAEAQTWLAGSTGLVRWEALPPLVAATVPFALLGAWRARDLPLLAHDDDSARALGVDGAGGVDGGDAGPALPVGGGESSEVGVGAKAAAAVEGDVVAGAECGSGAVSRVEVLVYPGAGPGEECAL